MLKLSDDHDGIRERLSSLGYNGSHTDDEKVAQALIAVHLTLQSLELTEGAQNTVLDLLSSNGRKALEVTPHFTEDMWRDFDYGNVKQGDFVRIKVDAYDSVSGSRHNGLVGVLKFMQGGQCSVEYIGLAAGNVQKHPMTKLDSLKWGTIEDRTKISKE